jgi:hypothetical protein
LTYELTLQERNIHPPQKLHAFCIAELMLTTAPTFASDALDLVNAHLRPGKQEFVPPQQVRFFR